MVNDNDEIEKLSIKERLECKRLQAETQERQAEAQKHQAEAQKHQAEAREHGKSLFRKPAFCSAIAPVILAGCVLFLTWIFGFLSKQKETEELLTHRINTLKTEVISNEKTILNEVAILRDSLKQIGPEEKISEKTAKELKLLGEKVAKVKTEDTYSFDDWYYKGALEFDNRKYADAIISFNNALETKPDKDPAAYTHNYIGAAYGNQGMNDKALGEYDKSIKLKSDNPLPYANKSVVYLRLTEYKKAFENLNKASEVYLSNGEYGKGIKNITTTLSTLDEIDMDPKTKTTIREETEQLKKHLEKELGKILGGKVILETK